MSETKNWKYWAGSIAAFFLGALILVAAWAKVIDPLAFGEQISAEGLDGLLAAPAVVMIALALEVFLGLALLLNMRRLWVLVPAACLVLFFLFLTGRTYVNELRGIEVDTSSCGCFGNLVQRTPAEAFWQDLFLLGPAMVLSFFGRGVGSAQPKRRLVSVSAATLGALGFAHAAPDLPLDDLATRLKPGVETKALCAGRPKDPEYVCLDALVPEVDSGEHWIVLTHLDEESLTSSIDRFHEHSLSGESPRLWLVSDATPEELSAFSWQWMIATEVRAAPPTLLRPLYRRLPRSFRVSDGRVVETIDGLPTLGSKEGEPSTP